MEQILHLRPTWMKPSNGTSTQYGEWLCPIILNSIHKYRRLCSRKIETDRRLDRRTHNTCTYSEVPFWQMCFSHPKHARKKITPKRHCDDYVSSTASWLKNNSKPHWCGKHFQDSTNSTIQTFPWKGEKLIGWMMFNGTINIISVISQHEPTYYIYALKLWPRSLPQKNLFVDWCSNLGFSLLV